MTPAENRTRLIRLIHVARRELGMEEDAYRAILQDKTGFRSTAECSGAQLQRVLDHLKSCGFKVRPARRAPQRAQDDRLAARKIREVWLTLHELGGIEKADEAALAEYVKRIAKVDDLRFLSDAKAWFAVLESLKKWAARVAVARMQELWLTRWADTGELEAWVRAVTKTRKPLADLPYDAALSALEKLRRALGEPARHSPTPP